MPFPNLPGLYRGGPGQGHGQSRIPPPTFANRMPPGVQNKIMGGTPSGRSRQPGMGIQPPPNLMQSAGGDKGGVKPEQLMELWDMGKDFINPPAGYGEPGGLSDAQLTPQWGSGGGPQAGGEGGMFDGGVGGWQGAGLGIGGSLLGTQAQGGSVFGGWFDGDKADTGETWAGIGSGAMTGFQYGGPWGALVGAGAGLIGAWT